MLKEIILIEDQGGKHAISDYLEDALDAAEKATRFVHNIDYTSFASNDEKAFAVVRALEIIGEAARHIPESFRSSYPNIPWEDMAGMRDVLIHGILA